MILPIKSTLAAFGFFCFDQFTAFVSDITPMQPLDCNLIQFVGHHMSDIFGYAIDTGSRNEIAANFLAEVFTDLSLLA